MSSREHHVPCPCGAELSDECARCNSVNPLGSMTITPVIGSNARRVASRFVAGQQVYVDGEFATVAHVSTNGLEVDVKFSDGRILCRWHDKVRTVAEALTHARYILTRTANHLGDVPLMDALEHAAPYIERAMQQCDAADAVKGLS